MIVNVLVLGPGDVVLLQAGIVVKVRQRLFQIKLDIVEFRMLK